jgi:hypothetical protein
MNCPLFEIENRPNRREEGLEMRGEREALKKRLFRMF